MAVTPLFYTYTIDVNVGAAVAKHCTQYLD